MSDYRSLPSIDGLMSAESLSPYTERVRSLAARQAVAQAREEVASGSEVNQDSVEKEAKRIAEQLAKPSLAPAINMAGVVLHTGLGRARLSQEAVDQVALVSASHAGVEFDFDSGRRGDRQIHVKELLKELTGAEDTFVVNNCAAALFLSLNALCTGREVILSRGQMVEIGGSFRMPDIVRQSGCQLVEVGCTNKTHSSDYSKAVTEETAAILRCHPSNFKIVGFHEAPSAKDLNALCKEHGLMLIDDVGSGCFLDTTQFGLPREQTLKEAVSSGADIITASGDKLMGGPQAGIILGSKDAVERVKRHPLARTLRVDKLTLAALEATLRLYVEGRHLEIPVWKYLSKPIDEIKTHAEIIANAWKGESKIAPGKTEVGGGSMPTATVETVRVGLVTKDPDKTAAQFRKLSTPVIGYIEDGVFWLDPRTAETEEVNSVVSLMKAID